MRIIAGTYRGRSLNYPKDKHFRPTQDRVKEAIFSSISPILKNAVVLDLCCGTGSFGLEALSRGASQVTLVDKDTTYAKLNVQVLQAEAKVIKANAKTFLEKTEDHYDILLFDPPYKDHLLYEAIFALVISRSLINEGGVFVVEYESGYMLPELPDWRVKLYKYGSTSVACFYR